MPDIELTLSSDISKLINDLKAVQATVDAFQKDAKVGFDNVTTSADKAFKDLKTGIDASMNAEIIKEFTKETNKATDAVDDLTDAERKRAKILQEEISDLAELKQRQKAAFTPEEIDKYNKAIKETEKRIGALSGGMKGFRDVGVLSLGEMRKELRALSNTRLDNLSATEINGINMRMAELTDKIGDTRAGLKATGDQTEMWIGGLQGITAAAQGVVGVLGTMGYDTERLEKIMINLIGVSQAMSTVYELHERGILKKMGAQIKSIFVTKAETVATEANAVATATADKASKGFFKTLKLNPLGLVLTGIVALGAGLYTLMNYIRGAKTVTDELYEAQKETFDEMFKSVAVMERLSTTVKQTAIGTEEHAKAINDYNASAKEQNLLTIDVNDTMSEQNTIMEINNNLLFSRAKLRALNNMLDENAAKTAQIQIAIDAARAKGDNKYYRDFIQQQESEITTLREKNNEIMAQIQVETDANKTRENIIIARKGQADAQKKIDNLTKTSTVATTNAQISAYEKLNKEINDLTEKIKEQITLTGKANQSDVQRLDQLRAQKEAVEIMAAELSKDPVKIPMIGKLVGIETPDVAPTIPINIDLTQGELTFADKLRDKLTDLFRNEELKSALKDVANNLKSTFETIVQAQIESYDRIISDRNQRIGEIQSLLQAETQLNEEGNASNIRGLEAALQAEQQLRDQAMKQREKSLERERKLAAITQGLDMASAIASIIKSASKTGGVAAPILAAISIASILALYAAQKKAANTEVNRFEKGGRGVLSGARHSGGGISLGALGEGETGEAYYIMNRGATAKYRPFMDAMFDLANSGKLSDTLAMSAPTTQVSLKEVSEIRDIRDMMKKTSRTYGNGFYTEKIGNVTRKIYTK